MLKCNRPLTAPCNYGDRGGCCAYYWAQDCPYAVNAPDPLIERVAALENALARLLERLDNLENPRVIIHLKELDRTK